MDTTLTLMHLSSDQKQKLMQLLQKHETAFCKDQYKLFFGDTRNFRVMCEIHFCEYLYQSFCFSLSELVFFFFSVCSFHSVWNHAYYFIQYTYVILQHLFLAIDVHDIFVVICLNWGGCIQFFFKMHVTLYTYSSCKLIQYSFCCGKQNTKQRIMVWGFFCFFFLHELSLFVVLHCLIPLRVSIIYNLYDFHLSK